MLDIYFRYCTVGMNLGAGRTRRQQVFQYESFRECHLSVVIPRFTAEAFFGEPALQLQDFMRTSRDGRGMINILAADQLIMSPRLCSTFLLWL